MLELDIAILKKAAKGDVEAFETMMYHYEKLVYNIAFRMFSNSEDAKDAYQEVFLKVYKNLPSCDDFKNFKSWICKITTNTCIDELRRRKGKITESLDVNFEYEDGIMENQLQYYAVKEVETPEDVLIKKETVGDIQRAINKLSETDKAIIVLRDIKGFSYEEVAKITDLNIGTVKSRLSRARQKLKDVLILEQKNKVYVIK